MAEELRGGWVQAEEGDCGLTGDQELGGDSWVTRDGGEQLPCLHGHTAHWALWVGIYSKVHRKHIFSCEEAALEEQILISVSKPFLHLVMQLKCLYPVQTLSALIKFHPSISNSVSVRKLELYQGQTLHMGAIYGLCHEIVCPCTFPCVRKLDLYQGQTLHMDAIYGLCHEIGCPCTFPCTIPKF